MYNFDKAIKTLELDKILNMLSSEAALQDAADLALNITPNTDINVVAELLRNTQDAFNMCAVTSAPNFGRASNVTSLLERCDAGGSMTCKEFLQLLETLRVIRSVKNWRSNAASGSSSIDELFNGLFANKYLEDKISFIIKSEDEISDNASAELSNIRKKISSAYLDIRNKLDRIVKNPSKAKYLQDAIVTQRDGRFVVPVKQEYRSEISGIVHDTSSSGSTLFIEPISVVEINNDIRVLKIKEKEEIQKILFELSAEVGSFKDSINSSYKALVKLSLVFAKASLAYKMRAAVPTINANGFVCLKNARHPLLDKKTVVPISVELGKSYESLIITGPNTGGKTVTLKTVGLLILMVMCGLMIPVDDNSSISVFEKILVDIGDEQSIEQSLSTFSSHMVNIIDIINNADNSSLVLLDELGGGTDPIEGAALARAILENLHSKCSKVVATTHYAELKTYALDAEGVENASCEFDISTLKPTYRLIIGTPGRSNAFAIADSLGLDKSIISTASTYVSQDDLQFENVLTKLDLARQKAEQEKNKVAVLKSELLKKTQELNSRLEKANLESDKILKQAKDKATIILENTRNKSNELLNSLEDAGKKISAKNAAELLNNARNNAKRSMNELEDVVDPISKSTHSDYVLPRLPLINETVLIASLGQKGVVLEFSPKKDKVLLSIGNLKTWMSINELRLIDNKNEKKTPLRRNVATKIHDNSSKGRKASMELDIRGFASDEGVLEVDRYIDRSLRSGVNCIAIIHGKGTGILRSAVHSFLKKHPSVLSYRLGTFGEGESGVTIVELK